MIVLTRLNGAAFALNPDLIERAEATPDTVVTLVDGKKYVVGESLQEIAMLVRDFRSGVIAQAQLLEAEQPLTHQLHHHASHHPVAATGAHHSRTHTEGGERGRVVPLPIREG